MSRRECLDCGMEVTSSDRQCPKCDANLSQQTDGSVLQIDVAHQRETVAEALSKVEQAIDEAHAGYYKSLRIIVGSGLIKEDVYGALWRYERARQILSYDYDGANRGAILIKIR